MSRTRATELADLRERFQRAGIDPGSAAAEAELLLLHALALSRADFWCAPGDALTSDEIARIEALAARREARVPLQQLIGTVEFHDITLEVAPGVFIPRPETETLVEAVLERLRGAGPPPSSGSAPSPTSPSPSGRLHDLGTGTGAIAIALLRALPGWTGVAVDRSPAALALAARNAERNGVGTRLHVVGGDFMGSRAIGTPEPDPVPPWAAAPSAPYDLVVSNPPYIPSEAIPGLMPEVRDHDPREALDGGPDGLDAYRAIAGLLPQILRDGGLLGLEMGDEQADALLGLPEWGGMIAQRLGALRIGVDLAGRQRVVVATWRGGGNEAGNAHRDRAGRSDRDQVDG